MDTYIGPKQPHPVEPDHSYIPAKKQLPLIHYYGRDRTLSKTKVNIFSVKKVSVFRHASMIWISRMPFKYLLCMESVANVNDDDNPPYPGTYLAVQLLLASSSSFWHRIIHSRSTYT